jgi:hypothetical protein
MINQKKLFDANRDYVVKIQHPDFPDGKKCTLRFPTDEEWAERTRNEVRIQYHTGQASREDNTNGDECNGWLFDKIRQDTDGPEFDEAEKTAAIRRIENVKFISIENTGSRYRVTLMAAGAEVVHLLNGLTEKQKREFGRAAVHRHQKRHFTEVRIQMEPSAELWAKLAPATEGYAEGSRIPITHKDIAATEVLREQHAELEESGDPEI